VTRQKKSKSLWVVLLPGKADLYPDFIVREDQLKKYDKNRIVGFYNNERQAHTAAIELYKKIVLRDLGYG